MSRRLEARIEALEAKARPLEDAIRVEVVAEINPEQSIYQLPGGGIVVRISAADVSL